MPEPVGQSALQPPSRLPAWPLGLPLTASLVVHALLVTFFAIVVARGPQVIHDLNPGPGLDVALSITPLAPPPPTPAQEDPPAPAEVKAPDPELPTPPTPDPKPTPLPPAAIALPDTPGPAPAPTVPTTDITPPAPPTGPTNSSATKPARPTPPAPKPAPVAFGGLTAERALSVVYVVDCSGPMVTTLPQVLAQVQRSVEGLSTDQSFSVILFGDAGREPADPPPTEASSPALVPANAKSRAALATFLKKASPRGKSNPLDGLKAGLSMQPDVIFLFSRSITRSQGSVWGKGLRATLDELDTVNPLIRSSRQTTIKTIQFIDDDPTMVMQTIARLHGGGVESGYRVMKREELAR